MLRHEVSVDLYLEALERFRILFEQVQGTNLREPTAVTLATADAAGRPSVRTVLLKGMDEQGFVVYTNFLSRKGRQLTENPRAALLFFWQGLFQQVNVEGKAEPVTGVEADAYWQTRARESQLGAWASYQSEVLDARETLERRLVEYEREYRDQPVPRPPHWSGFRIIPDRIEFWRAGPHRLHERVCYQKSGDDWFVTLLNP